MHEPLDELLPRFGLERLRGLLLEHAQPTVAFDLRDASIPRNDTSISDSRVGGRPHLPADFSWPVWSPAGAADDSVSPAGARPLDYLLQIRLAELPRTPANPLPETGTLTFFFDRARQPMGESPAHAAAHRVVYTPEETPLVPVARPGGTTAAPECSLVFRNTLTLPGAGTPAFAALVEAELDAHEQERYFDFEEALAMHGSMDDEGPHHHLLGYSENVGGDMRLLAQLVANGVDCSGGVEFAALDHAALEAGVDDWTLLLQLDSDDEAELEWGDTGMLYFWIRQEDLAARSFERCWVGVQSC